jgi:hypothetical protein
LTGLEGLEGMMMAAAAAQGIKTEPDGEFLHTFGRVCKQLELQACVCMCVGGGGNGWPHTSSRLPAAQAGR